MSAESTRELIQRAKAGDDAGLRELFGRYSARLLSRIRLMMGEAARRHAESGDFLQGVLVEVVQGIHRFEPGDKNAFLRWATQIARNNIRDEVRRKREMSLATMASQMGRDNATLEQPDAQAAKLELVEHLVDALEDLPEDQQLAVELRQFEGLSFEEVGRRLDRSANAARLLYNRALLAVGERIKRLN